MSEVSVNINGDGSSLDSTLDSLRDKLKEFGKDASNISSESLNDKTFTEKKVAIQQSIREISEAKKQAAREEYESARKSNVGDFSQIESDFKSGKISKKTFDEQKGQFESSQKEFSSSNEDKEILTIEREMNQNLRQIVREMTQQRTIARERDRLDTQEKQRGDEEFNGNNSESSNTGGKPGEGTSSTDNIRDKTEKKKEQEDEADAKRGLAQIGHAGVNLANGNVGSAVTSGASGAAGLVGMGTAAAATAAAVAAAMYGLFNSGDKIINEAGKVGAFRGRGATGSQTSRYYSDNFDNDGRAGNLGLSGEDLLQMMASKARDSKVVGMDLRQRTLEDESFKKGFGADISGMSKFERFTQNGETSLQVSMDMLNVLTSIERSSLKEGDLITLQEKINTQTSLFDIQRSKRDTVDPDQALRIMAAFESIGLSKKGEKAGDFLSSVIGGLGEGGSDNAMLMKYEMAKRTNPELANDPAALRRFVKYHNDDPDYMLKSLKGFGQWTGGNAMAQDDLIMSMFNPQSEADYEMIKKSMSGDKGFEGLLAGKGLNKAPKGSLNKQTMVTEAESSVGGLTQVINDLKNTASEIGTAMSNFFTDVKAPDGKSIAVTGKGNLPTTAPLNNKVSTGKK